MKKLVRYILPVTYYLQQRLSMVDIAERNHSFSNQSPPKIMSHALTEICW